MLPRPKNVTMLAWISDFEIYFFRDPDYVACTGMAVLEANFRRTPLSCLNELRLTSSLNEAQDNLP